MERTLILLKPDALQRGLVGRILSDFCYVLIDPRISFSGDR